MENTYIKKSTGTCIFVLCANNFFWICENCILFRGGKSTTAAADGIEVLRFRSSISVSVFQRCLLPAFRASSWTISACPAVTIL